YRERLMFSRPTPLTTPSVTVRSSPKGFPTASTHWPTRTADESPNFALGRGWSAVTLRTAKSVSRSLPTTCAISLDLSEKRTSISVASPITWLLVTMCPSGSMMTPDPDPEALGARSWGNPSPRPSGDRGMRFTTEGFADSAKSVMTVCISSSNRRPGESPDFAVEVSAAANEWLVSKETNRRLMDTCSIRVICYPLTALYIIFARDLRDLREKRDVREG